MATAVGAPGSSDADLAFQMQLNEAVAASLGISAIDIQDDETGKDTEMAIQLQQMELEARQKEELDRNLANNVHEDLSNTEAQLVHDLEVAREIDEMSDGEWEESGDLFERPFQMEKKNEGGIFRVFFRGYSVSDGGRFVGGGIGGAVLDLAGNQVVEVKKYIPVPMGKTVAQYRALIEVLNAVRSLGASKIILYTDSRAVHNQLRGYWRIGTRTLQNEYDKAVQLLDGFASYDLNLALHGENWPADNLARMASMLQKHGAGSSSTPKLHCIICMEDVALADVYSIKECSHRFCTSCVKQHLEAGVTSGLAFPVACPLPECSKTFTEEECQALLSGKALEIFLKKIAEARVPERERVYCPYPNCSELMDRRALFDRNPRTMCKECNRAFCLDCRVPWHSFYTCAAYQRLAPELRDAEDAKLYRLAENENWRQCKQCRRMIELTEGCYHMTCRCGYEFCYTCGAPYRNKLQTCLCKLWDERNIIRDEEEPFESEDEDFEDEYRDYDDYDSFDEYEQVGPPVVVPVRSTYKTQLCRFYERGACAYGTNCRFAHGEEELRDR